MDILESAEIANLLNSKGFVLQQESSPNRLRFERQSGDERFEIEILVSPPSLLARFKLGGNPQIYNATTFDELKTLLKEKIEYKSPD